MKNYIFYDSMRPSLPRCPHYVTHLDLLGKKIFYSEDDIKKLESSVSATIFAKIEKLKVGKSVKLHYLHLNGDLILKHIDYDEYSMLKEYQDLLQKIEGIKIEIYEKTESLQKELKKLKKREKTNFAIIQKTLKKSV